MKTAHKLLIPLAGLFLVASASADSFSDDFKEYKDDKAFKASWNVFSHPRDTADGSAVPDSSAGAVLLTAKQKDEGKTFTLIQIMNLKHSHVLPDALPLSAQAVFDQTETPNWAAEPISPNRVGFNGPKGLTLWGQVGIAKQDGSKLVAKVVMNDGSGEKVLAENVVQDFESYDGKPVRLEIKADSIDLLVDGKSVLKEPAKFEIKGSAFEKQKLRVFVQQQRVYAPQPRSSVLRKVEVIEGEQK